MYKMKSKRAIRKRIRLTGGGKLKRTRCGKRHILTKKTSKRKRHLRKPALVSTAQEKTYIGMIH
ncbi:MAG: 50S ribosomal protein L35 [Chlamydiota bacterium]